MTSQRYRPDVHQQRWIRCTGSSFRRTDAEIRLCDYCAVSSFTSVYCISLELLGKGGDGDDDGLRKGEIQDQEGELTWAARLRSFPTSKLCQELIEGCTFHSQIWFCSFISIIFAISQVSAQYVDSVEHLWRVSCLVGFAYGNLFALLPIVTLEIFGLAHFSSNWGIVSLSPGVGGNLANLMFGRVYDAHTIRASGLAGSARAFADKAIRLIARGGGAFIDPSDRSHDCIVGQQCYATAFKFTTTACIIALVLSLTAAIRRERQARKRKLAA